MNDDLPLEIKSYEGRSHFRLFGFTLHSVREPKLEAEQWASQLVVDFIPRTIFLLGDTTGDVTSALKLRFPGVFVAVLAAQNGLKSRLMQQGADKFWSPSLEPLENFVEDVLEYRGPREVRVEVWPAFERAAPSIVLSWLDKFRRRYRLFQGSWMTRAAFGEKFVKNALRNLIRWEKPLKLTPGNAPIVVAASGPSLEATVSWLKKYRPRFQLWALPSSLAFLIANDIDPDLGVASDGGWYARELLWSTATKNLPLLCGLGSAADRILESHRVAFFPQGEAWESRLCEGFPSVLPTLPAQGTVAVSAVRLALAATSGPVLVLGMDLVYLDLKGHSLPHPAHDRIVRNSNRLKPEESLTFEQVAQAAKVRLSKRIRTSQAMRTYAEWLNEPNRFDRKVYRISAENELAWKSMECIDFAFAETILKTGGSLFTAREPWLGEWPDRSRREILVRNNLARLGKELSLDFDLVRSLAPMEIDPAEQRVIAQNRLSLWEKRL